MSRRRRRYILGTAIIFTCLFSISFLVFNRYLDNKKEEIEEAHQETLAREKEKNIDDSVIGRKQASTCNIAADCSLRCLSAALYYRTSVRADLSR